MTELFDKIPEMNEAQAAMPPRQAALSKLRNGVFLLVGGVIALVIAFALGFSEISPVGTIASGIGIPMIVIAAVEWVTESRYSEWPVVARLLMLFIATLIVLIAVYLGFMVSASAANP